jgi:hypothetical protein
MQDSSENLNKEYVVVIRAGSRLRFAPNEQFRVNVQTDGIRSISLTFQTRYNDEGFKTPVPRELWIDARGSARSLNSAVTEFTNAALFFSTVISFCANGYAADCRFHLAYDNTPGLTKREFFEHFVEDERGLPRPSRRIDRALAETAIDVLGRHKHTERLRRAIVQYVLALKYWGKGEETLAVAHLFMGMETLVPVMRKNELARLKLVEPQELADHWGIPKSALDPTIRLDSLFQGDQECHKYAKRASDGVEHGYLGFDEIRAIAVDVREKTAAYLRTAIIKLLQLPTDTEQGLLKSPYEKPIGTEKYVRYLRGHLESDNDELAPEGYEYPIVQWRFAVTSFELTENDEFRLGLSQRITPRLAENVSFRPTSVEIYGPEGVISNLPHEPRILEPKIVSDDPKHEQLSGQELVSLMAEALQDGRLEELRIRTKDNNLLVIKPETDMSKLNND